MHVHSRDAVGRSACCAWPASPPPKAPVRTCRTLPTSWPRLRATEGASAAKGAASAAEGAASAVELDGPASSAPERSISTAHKNTPR